MSQSLYQLFTNASFSMAMYFTSHPVPPKF